MRGKRKERVTIKDVALSLENLAEIIERTVAKKEDLERFATKEDLERLHTAMDNRFELVDRRFEALEERVENNRLEIRAILMDHEHRITTLEEK
jgi:hypothetical protein